ncbi:polysaccharide biosynthesis protein [Bacillus alkalicellulosilyticus]|uniref:polysaccharide biosynthesis protein n=1 Tax=Alkalihalobacterium alkalicellulosilyticum TaxID=1912214 RepID=UPI000995F8A5|nr:nucleoside-diphosphate sugar epimerase/dehydratase [Bacillus alkalicellulosilyticus]
MAYRQRLPLLIIIDSLLLATIVFLSNALTSSLEMLSMSLIISGMVLLLSHHLFSFIYHLYHKAWEYASIGELLIIVKIVTLSVLLVGLSSIIIGSFQMSFLAVTWMLYLLAIGGSRFCWRVLRDSVMSKNPLKRKTLIVGAGSAGRMVARQLQCSTDTDLHPVAFIDDDYRKHNLDIFGIPVVGGIEHIKEVVEQLDIDNIVIAIPSLSRKELNKIFQECSKTKANTKILPLLEDLVTGKISVNQFRDVQVEDLLGRDPVDLDIESIKDYVSEKVVLVTGAGGSIGSEICRQISKFEPHTLVLLGHGENSIYAIEMELKTRFRDSGIHFLTEIADIQDGKKMKQIMSKYRPDVIYHAAAHKHVPLMERNPEEAVKNNVIGTMNVAEAASLANVDTFVLISSDKAVNPTSVMGSTKRLAEMVVQHFNTISTTRFIAVRFGNVLGSRGSVIPLFTKQIQNGGPVTVTHPEMVRYFMTIPEASRLVIQAGSLAKGGETFVLDMGEPVKIVDLARNLIKLSGHSIDEIEITYSGIRPGEKLFEELLHEDEVHEEQIYPNIYVGKTSDIFIEEIEDIILTFNLHDQKTLAERLVALANKKSEQPNPVSIPG